LWDLDLLISCVPSPVISTTPANGRSSGSESCAGLWITALHDELLKISVFGNCYVFSEHKVHKFNTQLAIFKLYFCCANTILPSITHCDVFLKMLHPLSRSEMICLSNLFIAKNLFCTSPSFYFLTSNGKPSRTAHT